MHKDDNRNLIYFLIASMALLFVYQYFVIEPRAKAQRAEVAAAASASSSAAAAGVPIEAPAAPMTRDQVVATGGRVTIDTPSLRGSLSLQGARIDDLFLKRYDAELHGGTPVEFLRPFGTDHSFYAEAGFTGANIPNLPGANTVWQLASGDVLGVGKPVVLRHDNGAGLIFERTLSIDENYMITIQDKVSNLSGAPVSLSPYAKVVRFDMPLHPEKSGVVHEGPLATWSGKNGDKIGEGYVTDSIKYKDLLKKKKPETRESQGGWFGITDKYWLAAVIPQQSDVVTGSMYTTTAGETPVFISGYEGKPLTVNAGMALTDTHYIFAGAKQHKVLQDYEAALKLPRFEDAIHWGFLKMLTWPMSWLLDHLYSFLKNFGLAILALTVIVKLVFYPLAHKSYESMLKMKAVQMRLQPKMDAIKKRFPDDVQKQQQETMKLYQEEKVNPMASLGGCLPMLLQIPVFYALYKVLSISLDMRHAPFFGFIHDLSAPDPTNIWNIFGLLPFEPATVPLIGGFLAGPLHVGIVAILYGLTMWLLQLMTPMTAIDPIQKRIFQLMPIIFTFFMAQFAIGLLIYWVWSNTLTMLQQYSIMRRLKVENPIDDMVAKLFKKKAT